MQHGASSLSLNSQLKSAIERQKSSARSFYPTIYISSLALFVNFRIKQGVAHLPLVMATKRISVVLIIAMISIFASKAAGIKTSTYDELYFQKLLCCSYVQLQCLDLGVVVQLFESVDLLASFCLYCYHCYLFYLFVVSFH